MIKSASPLTKFEIIPLQFPVSLKVAVFDRYLVTSFSKIAIKLGKIHELVFVEVYLYRDPETLIKSKSIVFIT